MILQHAHVLGRTSVAQSQTRRLSDSRACPHRGVLGAMLCVCSVGALPVCRSSLRQESVSLFVCCFFFLPGRGHGHLGHAAPGEADNTQSIGVVVSFKSPCVEEGTPYSHQAFWPPGQSLYSPRALNDMSRCSALTCHNSRCVFDRVILCTA